MISFTNEDPPLERIEALYHESMPRVARRAARHLSYFSSQRRRLQSAPLHTSLLCPDGAGLELAFVAGRRGLRYTLEVDWPDACPTSRVATAATLLEGVEAPVSRSYLARMQAIQRGRHLRYGAWVGGRHSPSTDAFKLYAEVPEDGSEAAADWLEEALGRRISILDAGARLEMVGLHCGDDGRVEFYGGLCPMHPFAARTLFAEVGFGPRWPEMFEAIGEFSHTPLLRRMPTPDMGFSVSVGPDGEVDALGLFAVARTLFGPDAAVRRRLLDIARRRLWDLGAYAQASQSVDDSGDTRHTMVSLTTGRRTAPTLTVGLSAQALSSRNLNHRTRPDAIGKTNQTHL